MQFVPDGPDVPLAVLQSQEEGHLALFCGAGVSVPAGLPLFGALVDDVFLAIRAVPTELEARESQAKNYDRVLNLLEARVGPAVRRAVLARLNTPAGVVSDVHASLVTLASDEGGHVRLVTTNYDRLFESSRPDVTWAAAPKLPVPKPARWSDVVHLHGILDPRDAEGQNIVLTSADFGRAYLVEQWASRFVSELFNHFDVLFIGYSVTDAVLRYLVDAIAAERRGDGRIHRAFALAPVEGAAGDSMAEWRARGIEPILYDPRDGHRALYDTLAAWSRMRSEGLQSKVNIVQEFGPMDPAGLPPEAISQMCWAVRDVGAAKALARLRERSSIRWLQEFEAAGVFGEAKEDALRSGGGRELERLSGFQAALIPWIASHVKNPDLAEWAVKKRGRLHAALEWAVRKGAQGEAVPAPFASLWYALTGSIRVEDGASFRLDILDAVASETWSPRLRQEVLEALSPCIEIRPPWRLGARQTPPTTADLVAAECELVAGQFTGLMLERLQQRDDWPSVLLDLSLDLVQRLRQALDYLAVVGHASEDRDPSYIQHPSIEPHAQNRHHSSWTRLIELVREATVVAGARDPRHAGALAAACWRQPYPLFRRLLLFMGRHGLVPGSELLNAMLADPARWLWSLQTELELLRTLPHLWRALGAEERIQLEAALLRGPSSDVRGGDGGDPEREEARSRWIWERLAGLSRGGAELGAEAARVLAGIEADHPRWVVREDERDMFPIWVGDAGNEVPGTAVKAEGRQTLSEEELLEALKKRSAERDGRLWESALVHQEDPRRLLRAALQIVREGLAGGGAWTPVLFRFHEAPAEPDVRASLLEVLEALPSEAVSTATEAHAASGALKALCVATGEGDRARVLGVWDTLYPAAAGIVADDSDDRLTVALNHPAGVLAESLFVVLKSRELRVGEGIPVDVRQRLETLLTAGGAGASTGRAIAASRLSLLWDLDSVWTATHAVPILDWARPEEATAAWQGFLWAPQVRPAMFVAIKAHFLATFDHLARLDRQIESLAGLLASAGLDGRAAMTPVETATALRRLGDKGRGAVAWWLERRLDGAGEKAATLWREQVGPWLEECWPEDLSARGPASAEALGLAVTRSGQAFSGAVRSVLPFLGPLEHAGMILHRLDELGLATREPESCLALLGALTPAEPGPWFGDFGPLLETTRNAKPELEASPAFRRLRDVVARYLA